MISGQLVMADLQSEIILVIQIGPVATRVAGNLDL